MRLPANVIEAIEGAAAKGARRLDARRPNWYKDIDLKTLDMGDGCLCICGQLYGEYGQQSVATVVGGWVNRISRRTWFNVAERYGFDMPVLADEWANQANDSEDEWYTPRLTARQSAIWNRLERAWKEQIKARLQRDDYFTPLANRRAA